MASDKLREPHRTYDVDSFRRRAGCIATLPFGPDGATRKIFLASSSSKPGRWVIPAGGIDHGESPEDAAIRELHEESGVRAVIGSARFLCWVENNSKQTRTAVFHVDVSGLDEDFPEARLRKRTCVTVTEAEALLAGSSGQLLVFRAALAAARELGIIPTVAERRMDEELPPRVVPIEDGAASLARPR